MATIQAVSTPFHLVRPVDVPAELVDHRVPAIDAYRGLIMLWYLGGALFISLIGHPHWNWLALQNRHADWQGCTAWDLLQPGFEFIVGVGMPFAFARRIARGQSWGRRFGKVVLRVASLILIGLFLDYFGEERVQTGLVRVLPQIAFGYFFAFFLVGRSFRAQALTALAILTGYGLLWTFNPWNGSGGPWAMGNQNIGSALDRWLVGHNYTDMYVSMNAIPATANIIFGVMAGQWLMRRERASKMALPLLIGGTGAIVLGLALEPWVPIIKHIWTPSFALFSAGITTLTLLLFHFAIEMVGWKRWAFPLVVVGSNCILAFVAANLFRDTCSDTLYQSWVLWFRHAPGPWVIVLQRTCFIVIAWALLYLLYRRRIFLRV